MLSHPLPHDVCVPKAARGPLAGTGAWWLPAEEAFSWEERRIPKEGDAVCLAAWKVGVTDKLRAGRRYTVREIVVPRYILLNELRGLNEIRGYLLLSLLAPATEAECLALHAALHLGREAGVLRALLEAHSEVAPGGWNGDREFVAFGVSARGRARIQSGR